MMRPLLLLLLSGGLGGSLSVRGWAQDASPLTIVEAYRQSESAFRRDLRAAATPAAKSELEKKRPNPYDIIPQLRKAVAARPDSKDVLELTAWLLRAAPDQEALNDVSKALAAHHASDPKVQGLFPILAREGGVSFGPFLAKVETQHPDMKVRARALFTHATIFLTALEPEHRSEGEALMDSLLKKFTAEQAGDELLADAQQALFKRRNIAVGKTAPDITGNDNDGSPLTLSQYRGKGVVLAFWGFW
jgi:hypothetical protein